LFSPIASSAAAAVVGAGASSDRLRHFGSASAASATSATGAPSGRLLKSHMTLKAALHGDPCPRGARPMYKAVVVLRDPADVRVSWFRHMRRLHRHFHPDDAAGFDFAVKLDQLAQAPAPRASSIVDDQFPEHVVAEALRALHSPQVCVVFYEELMIDARRVVERLARFTGWGQDDADLADDVARALEDDELAHPKWGRRRGASGSALKYFSPASQRFIEDRWDFIVRMRFNAFPTYEELYTQLTGQPYPLPSARALQLRTPHSSMGSQGGSRRNSGMGSMSRLLSKKPSTSAVKELADAPQLPVDPDDDSEQTTTLGAHTRGRRPSILGGGMLSTRQRRGSTLGSDA